MTKRRTLKPGEKKRQEVCKRYSAGKCYSGEDCKFLHGFHGYATSTEFVKDLCWDYIRGHCRRGASCRYKHPPATEEEVSDAVKAEIEKKKDGQPKQVIWDGRIGGTANQPMSQIEGNDGRPPKPVIPPPAGPAATTLPRPVIPPPAGLAVNILQGPTNNFQYSAPTSAGLMATPPPPPPPPPEESPPLPDDQARKSDEVDSSKVKVQVSYRRRSRNGEPRRAPFF